MCLSRWHQEMSSSSGVSPVIFVFVIQNQRCYRLFGPYDVSEVTHPVKVCFFLTGRFTVIDGTILYLQYNSFVHLWWVPLSVRTSTWGSKEVQDTHSSTTLHWMFNPVLLYCPLSIYKLSKEFVITIFKSSFFSLT